MQITVKLFAGLSEAFGASTVQLALTEADAPATAATVKQKLIALKPDREQLVRSSFLAINETYADDSQPVTEHDEIALLPPVSGGQQSSTEAAAQPDETDGVYRLGVHSIAEHPLSVEQTASLVGDDEHGAALLFVGTTRRTTFGQRTVLLEYEAYVPMALKTLRQIEDELAARWPGARCAISHRIGAVPVGETSVIIAVSTPHRADCYEASRYAIERLKQIVPIWKKEVWENGEEWKGPQSGPWNPLTNPE